MIPVKPWEVAAISKTLKKHVGKRHVICGSVLQHLIIPSTVSNYPRVRACINTLRSSGELPICSNGEGYWVAGTSVELEDCIKSLEHRIESQSAAITGLKRWLGYAWE